MPQTNAVTSYSYPYTPTTGQKFISLHEQQLTKQNVDEFIDQQLNLLRSHIVDEELAYVTKMLADNPVELERRNISPSGSGEDNAASTARMCRGTASPERKVLRQERADSCRKSRFNNKLKKAKLQYRSDFMANKVLQAKITLAGVKLAMEDAERSLLAQGYSPTILAQLRDIYGVDVDFKEN